MSKDSSQRPISITEACNQLQSVLGGTPALLTPSLEYLKGVLENQLKTGKLDWGFGISGALFKNKTAFAKSVGGLLTDKTVLGTIANSAWSGLKSGANAWWQGKGIRGAVGEVGASLTGNNGQGLPVWPSLDAVIKGFKNDKNEVLSDPAFLNMLFDSNLLGALTKPENFDKLVAIIKTTAQMPSSEEKKAGSSPLQKAVLFNLALVASKKPRNIESISNFITNNSKSVADLFSSLTTRPAARGMTAIENNIPNLLDLLDQKVLQTLFECDGMLDDLSKNKKVMEALNALDGPSLSEEDTKELQTLEALQKSGKLPKLDRLKELQKFAELRKKAWKDIREGVAESSAKNADKISNFIGDLAFTLKTSPKQQKAINGIGTAFILEHFESKMTPLSQDNHERVSKLMSGAINAFSRLWGDENKKLMAEFIGNLSGALSSGDTTEDKKKQLDKFIAGINKGLVIMTKMDFSFLKEKDNQKLMVSMLKLELKSALPSLFKWTAFEALLKPLVSLVTSIITDKELPKKYDAFKKSKGYVEKAKNIWSYLRAGELGKLIMLGVINIAIKRGGKKIISTSQKKGVALEEATKQIGKAGATLASAVGNDSKTPPTAPSSESSASQERS